MQWMVQYSEEARFDFVRDIISQFQDLKHPFLHTHLRYNIVDYTTLLSEFEDQEAVNPQAVAKAIGSNTVSAIHVPETKELVSVSLYKPFAPD